jgi:hypothetical protein
LDCFKWLCRTSAFHARAMLDFFLGNWDMLVNELALEPGPLFCKSQSIIWDRTILLVFAQIPLLSQWSLVHILSIRVGIMYAGVDTQIVLNFSWCN